MPTESTMLYARSRPSKANRGDVDLTIRRLIEVSGNPFDLWAKVTGKIDRAITSIGGYARDEALAEVLEIRS
jgi:hypothetical protein